MSDADRLINTALQRGVPAVTRSTNRLNGFGGLRAEHRAKAAVLLRARPGQKVRVRASPPETVLRLFLRHFAAPAQDFRFRAGGFGFFDVVARSEHRPPGLCSQRSFTPLHPARLFSK